MEPRIVKRQRLCGSVLLHVSVHAEEMASTNHGNFYLVFRCTEPDALVYIPEKYRVPSMFRKIRVPLGV